jgi:DNA polymerase-4
MTTRTILHVDMDAFYVAVELLRRPELRGRPVVVGSPGSRGVVAAASYEARRSGVHSAMSSVVAQRRCPGAVFLPPDHAHYGEVSAAVFEVFRSFTPLVEGISLDEAFLDVTGARRLLGTGVDIAHAVRSRIAAELGLACSVGVAPNKLLAKLASEAAKPRADVRGISPGAGVVEVRPGEELAFLHPLPVQALWGVGPATLERLQRLGVRTVGDLAQLDERALVGVLGHAHGRHLAALSRGIDDRPVEPDRAVKSIGHEETFAADLHTPEEVHAELVRMADAVAGRLRRHGVGARTLTLKVRFSGFTTVTRSTTVVAPLCTGPGILRAIEPLAASVDPTPGVRLLGISGSQLGEPAEQLSFDDLFGTAGDAHGVEAAWTGASEALDAIRRRFGGRAIGPASAVTDERA